MKFKFEIKDLFKLPNILCYLRILMVPLFLHVYFTAETPHDYYLATLIVLASGITDFLDGQIARRGRSTEKQQAESVVLYSSRS